MATLMKILIATQDDNLRLALNFLFIQEAGTRIVGSVDTLVGVVALAQNTPIDMVVLDHNLSGDSVEESIHRLRMINPALKILLINGGSDSANFTRLTHPDAVVDHSDPPEVLLTAFRTLHKGLIIR